MILFLEFAFVKMDMSENVVNSCAQKGNMVEIVPTTAPVKMELLVLILLDTVPVNLAGPASAVICLVPLDFMVPNVKISALVSMVEPVTQSLGSARAWLDIWQRTVTRNASMERMAFHVVRGVSVTG